MKLSRLAYYIILLCLVLLASCGGSASTPQASGTRSPLQGTCGSGGRTHTVLSNTPAVQGNWPLFHDNLNRDGNSATNGPAMLAEAWAYCTGAAVLSSPVVSNGVVYSGSTNGTLAALNARSSRLLWRFQASGSIYSTPDVENGMIYFGDTNGFVYAINTSNGQLTWKSRVDGTGAKVWSSPAVVNGLVFLGAASALNEKPKVAGEVLAFDAATGARRWRTWIMPDGAPGGGVWSSPAVDVNRDIVYVGTGDPDDGVQALSLSDGHLLWHWRSVVKDVGDTDVGSGPILYTDTQGRERVAVGGKNGNLYSLDAQSGRELWHTYIGNNIFGTPTYASDTLYVTGVLARQSVTYAINAETGQPLWHNSIPYIVYASPAISGHTLYLGVGDGFSAFGGGVDVIDTSNGRLQQFADLHSAATSSTAVLASWVFVGAQDGNLYAFIRR